MGRLSHGKYRYDDETSGIKNMVMIRCDMQLTITTSDNVMKEMTHREYQTQ